jgi:hypothetical protein
MRERLSLDRCRSVLPPSTTDQVDDLQVTSLRDHLYILADVVTELYVQFASRGELEELLERAAIVEFDGGLQASDAFASAVRCIQQRREEEDKV